jgi:hypothetical protein
VVNTVGTVDLQKQEILFISSEEWVFLERFSKREGSQLLDFLQASFVTETVINFDFGDCLRRKKSFHLAIFDNHEWQRIIEQLYKCHYQKKKKVAHKKFINTWTEVVDKKNLLNF